MADCVVTKGEVDRDFRGRGAEGAIGGGVRNPEGISDRNAVGEKERVSEYSDFWFIWEREDKGWVSVRVVEGEGKYGLRSGVVKDNIRGVSRDIMNSDSGEREAAESLRGWGGDHIPVTVYEVEGKGEIAVRGFVVGRDSGES